MHSIQTPWFDSPQEVIDELKSNINTGLDSEESFSRLSIYGPNELPQKPPTSFWKLVAKQFEDLLVLILLGAAIISFILALFEDAEDRVTAFVEPVVILLILIANACVGVVQETNAEKAITSLKRYEASNCEVLRDGIKSKLPATGLVPGDIVYVSVGDKVPADCRLVAIYSSILTADQSILTGESDSVEKTVDKLPKDNISPSIQNIKERNNESSSPLRQRSVSVEKTLYDRKQNMSTRSLVNQDKTNILFSGTLITAGKACAVVLETGTSTAIGKIHVSLQQDDDDEDTPPTPLKQQLDKFGEQLSKLIGVICVLVWLINIGNFDDPSFGGVFNGAVYYFKIAVALAVAAVPEGLPAVVTTCLALGTRQMAKEGAIVRTLDSVETLGCTTVICVDKTGTLTTNKMCCQKTVIFSEETPRKGSGEEIRLTCASIDVAFDQDSYKPSGAVMYTKSGRKVMLEDHRALREMVKIGSLCNEADVVKGEDDGLWKRIGEPTEAAIRVFSEKLWNSQESSDREVSAKKYWSDEYSLEHTLEFTRERKSMSVACRHRLHDQETLVLFTKGAPESLISRSTNIMLQTGHIELLTESMKKYILGEVELLCNKGLRCLALCRGTFDAKKVLNLRNREHFEEIEQHLTFIGIVGISDPVRESAKETIRQCKLAGVRIVVLTGDNQVTAKAVCTELGLISDRFLDAKFGSKFNYFKDVGPEDDLENSPFLSTGSTEVSGLQWESMSGSKRLNQVQSLVCMSRVEPKHKLEVVRLLEQSNEVVAMLGDGVNDAPALKKADIGVAMGSGTSVAKEASDLVLLDDNFSTIISAVRHGRAIFANTKQFIRYLVSSNIGEVCCIFFAAALGIPEVLTPVQLLWVNFVTDGLPATALSFNKPERRSMLQKPRGRNEGIINNFTAFRYAIIGLYVGVAVVLGFVWWFVSFEGGPQVTFSELCNWQSCEGAQCQVFKKDGASTVGLSILVMIEMLNAFNSLSEKESLLHITPFSNPWLIGAVALSVLLHCLILYIPSFASIFGVTPLSFREWQAVIYFSLPVIMIDEIVKIFARRGLETSYANFCGSSKPTQLKNRL
eukprot:snap_masked-scaffold_9-processed-gene-3.25-mRNA-1 protein AED:0.01 eAED:0.04 QI:0/0/0/1/1/1/4/0/1078